MTDRIDPGPGWRLLEPEEIVRHGDEFRWCGEWRESRNAGRRQAHHAAYRRRIAPTTTKAIATQAKIIAECEDGIRVTRTVSNPSGLTAKQMEFEAESFARQMSRLSQGAPMHGSSPAKYIMLEIQREGEP